MTCLKFDSWESGREEMRISLLAEETKIGDLLFMKYKVQKPIFELALEDATFLEDQDIKDDMVEQELAMEKAKAAREIFF